MDIIRKDATITPTGGDNDFPGTFQVILSAPTLDRDGETLGSDEWKTPLPDHITFDSDHGMSVATTVGSGVPRIDEKTGNLVVDGTFSSIPEAQKVRTLVTEKHIRSTSVAFMTLPKESKDAKTVRELLNGAFVAIPSNREALITSAKGVKAGARNSSSDKASIQAIHDHALKLGADPEGAAADDSKSARKNVKTKSLVGSLEATQDRVRDAVQDTNPGTWVYLRGTIPDGDGGGTVVFNVEDSETYDSETFKQSYLDDGSVVTLTGEPAVVDVLETVTADPDEDAAPSGAAEAPAAGTAPDAAKAAPVVDADSEKVKALATQLFAKSII